jgi:hypothetical protein
MKKVMLVALAVLVSVVFVSGVFAQESDSGKLVFNNKLAAAKVMTFEGAVLSHDVACHCVVVKGNEGNLTVQDDYAEFDQDYNRAKGLMIGANVKVWYKTVDYINYATKIQ